MFGSVTLLSDQVFGHHCNISWTAEQLSTQCCVSPSSCRHPLPLWRLSGWALPTSRPERSEVRRRHLYRSPPGSLKHLKSKKNQHQLFQCGWSGVGLGGHWKFWRDSGYQRIWIIINILLLTSEDVNILPQSLILLQVLQEVLVLSKDKNNSKKNNVIW